MKFFKGLLLPALLALTPLVAAKSDDPLVTYTPFEDSLANLFYFDDSNVVLVVEVGTGRIWRSGDAGKEWKKLENDIQTIGIYKNPFDNKVAIAVGEGLKQWITYDQGKNWREFQVELPVSFSSPISFNARDSKKILFHTAEDILFGPPLGKTWYTEDGFESKPKLLPVNRKSCIWAKGSDRFLMDDTKLDDRILCIAAGRFSERVKDFRLLISDDFFKTADEPTMSSGRTVQGMVNMAPVKGYIVAAAKAERSDELALYVTDDTKTWHRAEFGEGKIEEDAYTVLESTNYSIQVDVVTSRNAYMGSLYTSNSNGTYFTKNKDHTNRSPEGYVDFEKVEGIQGIVLVNVVDNWEEVQKSGADKKLKSQISFDDGRTWESLKLKDKDDELHLHSVTNLHNSGRVFSSPAPGILMGVGNTGKFRGSYRDGSLYVSDDAGLTWTLALEDPHKYEFGDQGSVLLAVADEGDAKKLKYSLKHGQPGTWKEYDLKYDIRVGELTTVPDSTSLKFIIYGSRAKKGGGRETVIVQVDFAGLHEDTCDPKKDFQRWPARANHKGEATCVMGHKQFFNRRKPESECFVGKDFEDPVPEFEKCECDQLVDYECDFNFRKKGEGKDATCVPAPALGLPKDACKDGAKTYKGPSGWRKIPGNECKGNEREEQIERDCDEQPKAPPSDGTIKNHPKSFKGTKFRGWYYLERETKFEDDNTKDEEKDETVVVLTDELQVYISHDHGKTWKIAVDDEVVAIYPHQYNGNVVYFITSSKKVYYSKNRGFHIDDFEAPQKHNEDGLQILQFHPKQKEWLIWIGGEKCERPNSACHAVASVTQKNGQSWEPLLPYVKKCAFVWREEGRKVKEETVFCEQYTNEDIHAPVELISSTDFFKTKDVKFKSVVEFATMSEFIIVATKGGKDGSELKLDASLDANTFADAKFPPKFKVDHQTAYTVLDSSTHSVFLHVTVNPRTDQEYGSIVKSNSNGTSYVLSVNAVNRNQAGYVDFEKMLGIEGVALVNIVANPDKVDGGAKKLKKTLITHNDGADWDALQVSGVDSEKKKYSCDVSKKEKCSLHLHGYTERTDPRETYSSPTAIGMMVGVGNVGEYLDTVGDASTFITKDGGITWREAKKGNYAWEFGDQGSIIVIVQRGKDVNHCYYSLDSGDNWKLHEFNTEKIRVESITTVPSDTSLNFIIWGQDKNGLVAINVDFSAMKEFEEKCKLHDDNPTGEDYDLWEPQHPFIDASEGCLFGHRAQYHRKKPGRLCKNPNNIDTFHNITDTCPCTRRDFECDYNFERQPGGECKLIAGLDLADPKAVCDNGAKEYYEITGYRKIPLSGCEGGKEMDHTSAVHACPGFEKEFDKKHGIGGFSIFLAVVMPFLAAGGIGYYVWRNWDGKFGRIRLGDGGSSFDSGSPWISWPVAAISGAVAVIAAIPLLIGSLFKMVAGRFGGYGGRTYTSRSSFARGRGDYAVVDPDEGELLGEDSDEDV